jgi:Flp pilus assembly protein TadD
MDESRAGCRALILAVALLPVLAAQAAARVSDPVPPPPAGPTGVFSDFLTGEFAASDADPHVAAQDFLRGLAVAPANPELLQQALLATAMSGMREAVGLARQLPDNPIGQMLLGDEAARAGDWDGAAQRFRALPQDGVTKLLRPLLIAWAEQGAGRTDAALAGLEPMLNDARFRGVYALHAALIADLGGRTADAARFYHIADSDLGTPTMRLAQILGSFEVRQGHEAEALRTLNDTAQNAPILGIALPAVAASLHQRPVPNAISGLAEAYLGLAAALRQDNEDQLATVLLRLSIGLRPDFTAARLLIADVQEADHHPDRALDTLAPVGANDPLVAVVQMRRAELEASAGKTDEAMRLLQALSKSYPDSSLPDAEAGDLLRAKSDYAAAAAAYSRAIARVGTPSARDWPLFYDRGVAYDQANQWPLAEADFKHALQLDPNEPIVLNYLGYSWADRNKDLAHARQMIEQAVHQSPDDGAIVDSLGWVMLRQGDINDAVQTLERATELMPEDPTINGHLGDAYWAAGRKIEAAYQWRRALTFNPQPADAAKLQAKLNETTAQASAHAPATQASAQVPATQEQHIP